MPDYECPRCHSPNLVLSEYRDEDRRCLSCGFASFPQQAERTPGAFPNGNAGLRIEKTPSVRLNDIADDVRQSYEQPGATFEKVGLKFGISRSSVIRIVKRERAIDRM